MQVYYRSQEEGWWEPDTPEIGTGGRKKIEPGERGEESVMYVRVPKLSLGVPFGANVLLDAI